VSSLGKRGKQSPLGLSYMSINPIDEGSVLGKRFIIIIISPNPLPPNPFALGLELQHRNWGEVEGLETPLNNSTGSTYNSSTLQWCEGSRLSEETILWILIFSQTSDMQYSTPSQPQDHKGKQPYFFLLFSVLGLELSLTLATQVLYHCVRYFWEGLSNYVPGLASNSNPPDLCLPSS
jgi:hypothetical protein